MKDKTFVKLTNEDLYSNISKYDITTLEYNYLQKNIDIMNILRFQNIDYHFCFNYVIENKDIRLSVPEITYLQPHLDRNIILQYINRNSNE